MNHVFLLKTFIVITLTTRTFAMEYIDVVNALDEMSKNNFNHSSHNYESLNKYIVILNNGNDANADRESEGGPTEEMESVRRQAHGKARIASKLAELKKANIVKMQHLQRVAAVAAFMENHYMTTVYLYNEVERIKKKRKIMDRLRRMVFFLEQPGNEAVQEIVMKCYQKERVAENFEIDVWKHRTPNNLIINILKDPENDGVAN